MLVLIPLHDMVSVGAVTPNEIQFMKAFGKDLEKAWNYCKVSIQPTPHPHNSANRLGCPSVDAPVSG